MLDLMISSQMKWMQNNCFHSFSINHNVQKILGFIISSDVMGATKMALVLSPNMQLKAVTTDKQIPGSCYETA